MLRTSLVFFALLTAFVVYIVTIVLDQPRLAVLAILGIWCARELALHLRRDLQGRDKRLVVYLLGRQEVVHSAIRSTLLLYASSAIWDPDSVQFALIALVVLAQLLSVSYLPNLVTGAYRSHVVGVGFEGLEPYCDAWRWFDLTSTPFRRMTSMSQAGLRIVEPVVLVVVAVIHWSSAVAIALVLALATYAAGALMTLLTGVRMFLAKSIAELRDRIVSAVNDYQPEVVLYFSAARQKELYQVRQWLGPISDSGHRTFIMTRESRFLEPLSEISGGMPVLLVERLSDLEQLLPASVKAALYVNNGMKNAHLLRNQSLQHIQLLHGESDKLASSSKFTRAYDKVFVAGQLAIDRYASNGVVISPEQFRIVGRPGTDALRTASLAPDRPVILYAPTWEGVNPEANSSSLATHGELLVRTVLDEFPHCILHFRPHPLAGTRSAEVQRSIDAITAMIREDDHKHGTLRHRIVDPADTSVAESFDLSSVMVTDVSSVLVDYLATEKPIVVCDVEGLEPGEFGLNYPTAKGSYVVRPDLMEIVRALQHALDDDPLAGQRRETRRYVLGAFEGSATQRFIAALSEEIQIASMGVPPEAR